MSTVRDFQTLAGCKLPLLQSGMGGVAQARLAAAVAETGAVGMVGLYRHTPSEVRQLLAEAFHLTDKCIGVNFVPYVLSDSELEARLDAVFEGSRQPLITFFGMPSGHLLKRAAARNICGVQVGNLDDAKLAFSGGAAFVVLQTSGAGGHHLGTSNFNEVVQTFLKSRPLSGPVLLAGGIGTSKDVARALSAGFAGVLCGTVFAAAAESNAHRTYKQMIVAARPEDTTITDTFSIGWHTHRHRVIRNRTCDRREPAGIIGSSVYFGKRYPILRYGVAVPTDATEGAVEQMALYCGVSCSGVAAVEPAKDVVARLSQGF